MTKQSNTKNPINISYELFFSHLTLVKCATNIHTKLIDLSTNRNLILQNSFLASLKDSKMINWNLVML